MGWEIEEGGQEWHRAHFTRAGELRNLKDPYS